jgi:hypothetical protein
MKYQPPYGAPGVDDPYINGDPSIARQGSILPAAAAEYPQREIVNFIENSNIAPSDNDLEQLTKATRSQFVNFCIDTGSINNLSVALEPSLGAYKQGVPLRVLVKNNNTGPTTINVNSLGNRPVVRASGAQLEADDLRAGMIALLVDDGTKFQMVNFQGILASAINNYLIDIPYAQDTGTPNVVIGLYSPVITSAQSGDLVLIRIANRNTGPVMFTVNSLAATPIRRNDGQPLQQNDLQVDEILLLVYNVNYWQVIRMVRSQFYMKLSADLVLYVRTDGNDTTGDGHTNTADRAFLTVSRAIEFVRDNWLIGGRTVTIQLGIPGTYYGRPGPNNSEKGRIAVTGLAGRLIIRGDPNNITGYNMQGPTGNQLGYSHVLYANGAGVDVTLQGLTFSKGDAHSACLQASSSASMTLDNIAVSGTASPQSEAIVSSAGANITVFNYVHVYTNFNALYFAIWNGSITVGQWYTNNYNHGISFQSGYVFTKSTGSVYIAYGWANFTGVAYGPRYLVVANSVLDLQGGPVSMLPGSAPGYLDDTSAIT